LSVVYFTGRDLGKQFPAILRASGLTVERHHDHFAPNAPDEEWLRTAGEHGWIAISHDKRIRHKPNELAAVMMHQVALLVVVGKALFPELARSFVATRASIERFMTRHAPPYIVKVYRASPKELTRNPLALGRWRSGTCDVPSAPGARVDLSPNTQKRPPRRLKSGHCEQDSTRHPSWSWASI
jgi:hypothetical protein